MQNTTTEKENFKPLLKESKKFFQENKISLLKAKSIVSTHIINSNGYKTDEREKILEIIYSIEKPFKISDLQLKVNTNYSISKKTIYNTINLFVELKIIKVSCIKINNKKLTRCFEIM